MLFFCFALHSLFIFWFFDFKIDETLKLNLRNIEEIINHGGLLVHSCVCALTCIYVALSLWTLLISYLNNIDFGIKFFKPKHP